MAEDSLVWLYGITAASSRLPAGTTSGLGGAPVYVVEAKGLAAIASNVDSHAFGEQELRRHFEDLDWLEAVARAHDAVIREVGQHAAVIPLRLATIYASEEHARQFLKQHDTKLSTALRTLDGRTEWGVKAYAINEPRVGQQGPPSSGREYVRRRRAQLSAGEDAERQAIKQVEAIHAALASLAVAVRTHAPRNSALDPQGGLEVFNGAYLVDRSQSAAFHRALREQEQSNRGVRLVLTGPWPAYSFVEFEQART